MSYIERIERTCIITSHLERSGTVRRGSVVVACDHDVDCVECAAYICSYRRAEHDEGTFL